MYGFMIKKWFFDLWDNMLQLVVLNLMFILAVGGVLGLNFLLSFNTYVAMAGTAVAIIAFNVIAGAAAMEIGKIANFEKASIRGFIESFKEVWKHGVVFGVITVLHLVILFIAFPFYTQLGGIVGLLAMAIIFWMSVVWWLASQYYFPIVNRLDKDIKKVLKKSFILFFDNTVFSIFMGIGGLAILIISTFTAFLLPGIGAIFLWHQVGVRLRLLKYDYLEENPEADRKRIPWAALLIDEKDRVGPRTFRGMIFPWKE